MENWARLTRLDLQGFKTIERLENFEFRPLNVLIGANAAGKSNLISFFRLLNWMTPAPGNLQEHIARSGGASALLHDGAARTAEISATLCFEAVHGNSEYYMRLSHAAGDTLVFSDEKYGFAYPGFLRPHSWFGHGPAHLESKLASKAVTDKTAGEVLKSLKGCVVYQFHNTSSTARLRQKWSVEDSRLLKEDAANLAPVLHRLRNNRPEYYLRIVETIRQTMPFFGDFELEPEYDRIMLQWRERGSDMLFGPHQASDGSLRLFALLTLLLQPPDELPPVLILDEPELGLHPHGIAIVAGLLKSVSVNSQVILATQSMTLIDHFDPEDIVVVDRPGRASRFRRLESEELDEWLKEYSLAELWEKNVLGGRPSPAHSLG